MKDYKEEFTGPSLGVPTIEPGPDPGPSEFVQVLEILHKHLGYSDQMCAMQQEINEVMMKARMHHWRAGMADGRGIYGTPINREVEE